MCKRDRELYNLERKYVGKDVYFYWCDIPSRIDPRMPKFGPYEGVVEAITNNEAEALDCGEERYSSLGGAIISSESFTKELTISLIDVHLIK